MAIAIDQDVMEVLSAAEYEGPWLRLTGQLERKLYLKTNKVLEAIGFRWMRKAGRHEAERDVADILDEVLLTGRYTNAKQEFDAFFTPDAVSALVMEHAGIRDDHLVLEPSAGKGALAIAAAQRTKHVVCVEKNPVFAEYLRDKVGFPSVIEADFLEVHPGADLTKPHSIVGKFDRVVMNPPFSKGQEVRHVMHALQFLRPGGRLVSVMSAAVQFRQDGPYRAFRDMLDCAGDNEVRAAEIELLPANSFKESGTGVNTVLAIIDL